MCHVLEHCHAHCHCNAHCHCHARLDSNIIWMAERLGEKAKDIADCQKLPFCDAAIGQPPKGKGKGVPQFGDPDGPLLVDKGWCKSYKLWVGDLPRTIDTMYIGQLCPGFIYVAVNNTKSKSGCSDHLRGLGTGPESLREDAVRQVRQWRWPDALAFCVVAWP